MRDTTRRNDRPAPWRTPPLCDPPPCQPPLYRRHDLAGRCRLLACGALRAAHPVIGTTASALDGTPDRAGDTYRQTLDAIRRGVRAVEALGGTFEDVVRTRVMLVPGARWQDAARAHCDVFDEVRSANTKLFVAGPVGEGLLIEVEIDAELPAATSAAPEMDPA